MLIFYDPKLGGEPTRRPNLRTAFVKDQYGELVKLVLKRHHVEGDPIGVNDAFLLFDTNKQTTKTKIMEPFAGKDKVVKNFNCHKDEDSVSVKFQRIKAVGVVELGEGLHVVTQTPLRIPVGKFADYQGSTASEMIGSV